MFDRKTVAQPYDRKCPETRYRRKKFGEISGCRFEGGRRKAPGRHAEEAGAFYSTATDPWWISARLARPLWSGADATPAYLLNAPGREDLGPLRLGNHRTPRPPRWLRRGRAGGLHPMSATFGSQLLWSGVDFVTVAELMGHAGLDTPRFTPPHRSRPGARPG